MSTGHVSQPGSVSTVNSSGEPFRLCPNRDHTAMATASLYGVNTMPETNIPFMPGSYNPR